MNKILYEIIQIGLIIIIVVDVEAEVEIEIEVEAEKEIIKEVDQKNIVEIIVEIIEEEEEIMKEKIILIEIIQGFFHYFLILEKGVTKINTYFTIPGHLVSLLIGKKGGNVRAIMNSSGAVVTFCKELSISFLSFFYIYFLFLFFIV